MRKVETVEQMPAEYRDTLLKIIYALASTEFASVEQHQPWLNKGPTAEGPLHPGADRGGRSAPGIRRQPAAADLRPDGEALAERLLTAKMGEHPLHAFNVAFESWPDVCGFCFLMDHVAWYHLRAFEDSSFAPFAREMTTMVHEERFHASFGARRIRGPGAGRPLTRSSPARVRQRRSRPSNKWYPHALDTFGAANSKFSDLAVRYGIRRWGNEELRNMWKEDLDKQIAAIGLRSPMRSTAGGFTRRIGHEAREHHRSRERRRYTRARSVLPRARGARARRAVERRERDRALVSAAEVGADDLEVARGRAAVRRAPQLVSAEKAARRVVMLVNPGARNGARQSGLLYSGVQVMDPGESTSAHRHQARRCAS
jgi:1,2-phenylacetyl-CoA epoxidase catalytic subunit